MNGQTPQFDRSLGIGLSVARASDSFTDLLALAGEAESVGFDLVLAGDSGVETFALMGALAARTERVKLVSSVAGWTRSPATMAFAASTIQNLSGGRFVLGVGATPKARVEGWHGMRFSPVIERMREYVVTLRACLRASSTAPTDVEGKHFPSHGFHNADISMDPVPPVLLGVTLPRMTELAGEVCEGAIINGIVPLQHLRERSLPQLDVGARRGGRAATELMRGVGRFAGVHDDRATAYDLARAQISFYFAIPYLRTILEPYGFEAELAAGEAAVAAGDRAAQIAAVSDRMVDELALAGTPGEVLEKLTQYEGLVDWVSLGGGLNLDHATARDHTGRILRLVASARS
ncbi:MAG: LLM class flavin-dependent oxidoreductase [Nocardioidaceae bacterium]